MSVGERRGAERDAAARPNVLESRATTSEEVFQRILRKLQREENFNAVASSTKNAGQEGGSAGLAAAMLAGTASPPRHGADDDGAEPEAAESNE